MSYTIVHDQQQASRDLENVVNQIKRHCRIGKVTPKAVGFPKCPAAPKDWWKQPFPFYDPLSDIMIGANRKCSCKPGQACGNAACPYMPMVTC